MKKYILIVLLKFLFVVVFLAGHQYVSYGLLPKYNWSHAAFTNTLLYALIIPVYSWLFKNFRNRIFDSILFSLPVLLILITAWDSSRINGILFLYPEIFPVFLVFSLAIIWVSFSNARRKLYIISLLLIAVFFVDIYIVSAIKYSYYNNNTKIVGKVKPISGLDMQGRNYIYNPSNYKVTILTTGFLACLPCRQLNPLIQNFFEYYRNNAAVLIVKFNPIDMIGDMQNHIKSSNANNTYLNIKPNDNAYFSKELNITQHPTILVVDKKGIIRFRFDGFSPRIERELKNEILNTVDKILIE